MPKPLTIQEFTDAVTDFASDCVADYLHGDTDSIEFDVAGDIDKWSAEFAVSCSAMPGDDPFSVCVVPTPDGHGIDEEISIRVSEDGHLSADLESLFIHLFFESVSRYREVYDAIRTTARRVGPEHELHARLLRIASRGGEDA